MHACTFVVVLERAGVYLELTFVLCVCEPRVKTPKSWATIYFRFPYVSLINTIYNSFHLSPPIFLLNSTIKFKIPKSLKVNLKMVTN